MTEAEKNKIKFKILDSKMTSIKGIRYISYEDIMSIIQEIYEDKFD